MNQGGFPSGALGAGDIRNRIIPHHPDLGREIGHFLPQPKDLWVRFVYANLAGDDTSRKELTKLKPRQHLFQFWIIIGKQVILIAL